MKVWMAARLTGDERGWVNNGIFSTKEAALAACKESRSGAIQFTLDEDVTEITDFLVCTPENPEGVMTSSTEIMSR